MAPDDVIALVKDSGLRGRGGAGFPTGQKWSFIPQGADGAGAKPHYLVINADESEPGTCKDIPLMMATPHVLVEGAIIAAYAIRARHAFIYVRGEVVPVLRRLQTAVAEAYAAGYLGTDIRGSGFDLDLVVHAGAGAYICGEETALLDSLEGRRGQPRLRPPFPAVAGLYACPTVVNNVESIASVPAVVRGGVDWFKSMGSEKSPGFTLYSLSGHVTRPGQYEAPLGITLRELLDYAGGVRAGHELKFWTPGGSSTPLLTAEHLDVPLDYENMAKVGSMLGTKALQIFDETTCVVRAVRRWTQFYAHESCGKCTPCREGTYWLAQIYERLETGPADEADLDKLLDIADAINGKSFCALGDGAASPILSSDQVLPRRVRRPPRRRVPVRPARIDARTHRKGLAHDHPLREQTQMPLIRGISGAFASARGEKGDALLTTAENKADPTTSEPAGVEMVTLTIDDHQISVPKGTLVIRAAELMGIQIPRFCDHPLLEPVGACRQCLVEVEGQRKPMASCTITVTPDMVVRTQLTSEIADKAQHGVMELLLINHPLDCPVCDKGGECPLQNQAMSNGQADTRFDDVKRTFPKPINLSSQVLLDRERCVLCAQVHAVLQSDRRRPVHRTARTRCAAAGRHRRRHPVRLLLLRQHRAGLPGRRADRHRLPVPGPPVRPGVLAERVRALRVGLRPAHRPSAREGAAPARPVTTPRSTRSGTATRAAGRSPTPARVTGSPRRWSARPTAASALRRGRRPSRSPSADSPPPAGAPACWSAAGRRSRTPTRTPSSPGSCWAPTTSTSAAARTRTRRRSSWPPRWRAGRWR